MFKAGMNGRRKDQVCGAELLDSAQTLKFRRVHQLDLEAGHFDVAVYRVTNEFSFTHSGILKLTAARCWNSMSIQNISHTFFDFELERLSSPDEIHLVKILCVDGRRFTYELRGPVTDEAVTYIKSLIDAVVFSDLVIDRTDEGYEAREATTRLKKHS